MRTWHTTLAAGIFVPLLAFAASSQAQQVTIGNRFHTAGDSFFENSTVSWSGHYNFSDNSPNHSYPGQGITFSFGTPALSKPQFGSPDPSAGLSTNFAVVGNKGQINFATNFSQGYKQALTTQAPSVTLMNGQTGYISDTSVTPFVVSVIPVVGAFPASPQQLQQISGVEPDAVDPRIQAVMQAHANTKAQAAIQAAAQGQAGGPIPPLPPQLAPNNMAPRQKPVNAPDPLSAPPDPGEAADQRFDAAQESTAGRPALSVAEAKRLHQQEQAAATGEMAALMERARALEEDGQPNVAKIYYQRIAKHASGELQQQARSRLYELQGSAKP